MKDSFLPATTWPPDTNLVASPAHRKRSEALGQQGAVFHHSLTHLWWGWPQTHQGRRRPQTEYRWAQRGFPVAFHSWTLLLWILTKKEKLYFITKKGYRLQQVTTFYRCSSEATVYVETVTEFKKAVARMKKSNCCKQGNQTKWLQTNVQRKNQSKTQETFYLLKYVSK